MSDKLDVNEIFYSIDGEGRRAGCASVFVRLAGCNLRCNYCDTAYALFFKDGTEMDVSEIITKIEKYSCKNITITGGEPLIHNECKTLIKSLWENGYDIVVETNGSVSIMDVAQYASICMDWKMPFSGMCENMMDGNLGILWKDDVLKTVVRASDLPYLRVFLDKHRLKCPVYISPVYGEIQLPKIAEFIKKYHGDNILRMQLQMHKFIWNPNERGV